MVNKKAAVLFPGQGTQYVGMGKDFYVTFKESQEVFDRASEVLGFDVPALCFSKSREELNKTSMCQPAILVTSIAILEVLRKNSSLWKDASLAVAGLSLGEYTAHVSAGSLSFADAVRLVYKRGVFMQEACDSTQGGWFPLLG